MCASYISGSQRDGVEENWFWGAQVGEHFFVVALLVFDLPLTFADCVRLLCQIARVLLHSLLQFLYIFIAPSGCAMIIFQFCCVLVFIVLNLALGFADCGRLLGHIARVLLHSLLQFLYIFSAP